ncbi:TraB/GumN family protein [Piscibacillus sp. B03]|uniref:TraB/GumN family protein n=1 Tax=Piscibacillus sp. B03 TaxID=3457430 RepID=UPI003FCE9A06
MKKLIWLILLLGILVIAGCTDTEPEEQENVESEEEVTEEVDSEGEEIDEGIAEEEDEEVTGDRPEGFLWKVEEGPTKVYMLGTIHIAPDNFFPMSEHVEQAYEESDVVVPEIDMNNVNMGEMMSIMTELGQYSDGTTLKDHVSQETYEQIEDSFQGSLYTMDMLNQFKPWLVTNLLEQMRIQELGYTDGVDMHFLNKAEEDEKEVIALETVEDQLGVFAGISDDYQVEMLEETLAAQDQYEEELNKMLDLYSQGDKEALLDMLIVEGEESDPEAEAYLKALNDDRNYNMTEQIKEFLESGEEKTYFVIVGALHLTLEPHIGSILEENGFEVERIQE